MKNCDEDSYKSIRNRKFKEFFGSKGGVLCIISLVLMFILQLFNRDNCELLSMVISIVTNLLCSYFAACVFYVLINLIPESHKEAKMRPKIISYRNRIMHSILRCINALHPFEFKSFTEPHKTREDFIKEFSKENIGKDDQKTLDTYLGVLQLNREKIGLLVDSLLLIREYLSFDEIRTLYLIKDSLFLTEKLSLADYYIDDNGYKQEIPDSGNQLVMAESIYNIYEQIKAF